MRLRAGGRGVRKGGHRDEGRIRRHRGGRRRRAAAGPVVAAIDPDGRQAELLCRDMVVVQALGDVQDSGGGDPRLVEPLPEPLDARLVEPGPREVRLNASVLSLELLEGKDLPGVAAIPGCAGMGRRPPRLRRRTRDPLRPW